jgi:hypothetical protein
MPRPERKDDQLARTQWIIIVITILINRLLRVWPGVVRAGHGAPPIPATPDAVAREETIVMMPA